MQSSLPLLLLLKLIAWRFEFATFCMHASLLSTSCILILDTAIDGVNDRCNIGGDGGLVRNLSGY